MDNLNDINIRDAIKEREGEMCVAGRLLDEYCRTREKRLVAGSIQKIECKKRKKGVLLLPVVESSIHTVNIS